MLSASRAFLVLTLLASVAAIMCLADDAATFQGRELLQVHPAFGGRHMLQGPATKPQATKPTASISTGTSKQQGNTMMAKQPRRALNMLPTPRGGSGGSSSTSLAAIRLQKPPISRSSSQDSLTKKYFNELAKALKHIDQQPQPQQQPQRQQPVWDLGNGVVVPAQTAHSGPDSAKASART